MANEEMMTDLDGWMESSSSTNVPRALRAADRNHYLGRENRRGIQYSNYLIIGRSLGMARRQPLTTPRSRMAFLISVTVLALLTAGASAAVSSERDHEEGSQAVVFSLDVAGTHQFRAKVTRGGDVSVTRIALAVDVSGPAVEEMTVGFGLSYTGDDYGFSALRGFSVARPWRYVHRIGLNGRVVYPIGKSWSLSAVPTVQLSAESGADWSRAFGCGAVVSTSYRPNPGFMIGLGVAAFKQIERTSVFPIPLLSVKLSDRWRIGNSFRSGGPTPAGFEVVYKVNKDWEATGAVGYRSSRFRLNRHGPVCNGIGQDRSVPVGMRFSRALARRGSLDLYGGIAFSGSLRVEDKRGRKIDEAGYRPAPYGGISLRAAF